MVSDRCTVGAGCAVDSRETLLTGTVIHSRECHRYTKKLPTQVSTNMYVHILPHYNGYTLPH